MDLKVLSMLALTTLVLTGCGMIRGAGEDLQKGGEAIQKAAKKVSS